MKEKTKKRLHPVFAIYSVAVTWVICASSFPMYKLSALIVVALLSLFVYMIVKKLCREDIKPKPVSFEKTGVVEADTVIKQGSDFIKTLDRQNALIPDTMLSEQIDRLKQSATEIFVFVERNPNAARQLNTFMDYYFPTTIKLLDSYIELQNARNVSAGNITDSMVKIESVMENICVAFAKQLDTLFEHKNVDIKSDIDVLKTIIAREKLD